MSTSFSYAGTYDMAWSTTDTMNVDSTTGFPKFQIERLIDFTQMAQIQRLPKPSRKEIVLKYGPTLASICLLFSQNNDKYRCSLKLYKPKGNSVNVVLNLNSNPCSKLVSKYMWLVSLDLFPYISLCENKLLLVVTVCIYLRQLLKVAFI